jgi:hypothetical protein
MEPDRGAQRRADRQALKRDMSLAELEKYYSEDNMRKVLY